MFQSWQEYLFTFDTSFMRNIFARFQTAVRTKQFDIESLRPIFYTVSAICETNPQGTDSLIDQAVSSALDLSRHEKPTEDLSIVDLNRIQSNSYLHLASAVKWLLLSERSATISEMISSVAKSLDDADAMVKGIHAIDPLHNFRLKVTNHSASSIEVGFKADPIDSGARKENKQFHQHKTIRTPH